MDILVLSDIHGNYPALVAVDRFFQARQFDLIINCGDSTVYGPFPNETLQWLQEKKVQSILGNTDRKVIRLLKGKGFKKPKKEEKRIMYRWTKNTLSDKNRQYLLHCKKQLTINLSKYVPQLKQNLFVFHGSPDNPDEFLFSDTPVDRFRQLARQFSNGIILIGHSHTPFYTTISSTHFINPGSVGRMFDGDPSASCATLHFTPECFDVQHFRIPYPVQQVVEGIKKNNLPDIYTTMYILGKKLN